MADRASTVAPTSAEVNDAQVSVWRDEIKAITDLSTWASRSERDKIEILTKLSFVLSNLWTTEDITSFEHALSLMLQVISMARNDGKAMTLSAFSLQRIKWGKVDNAIIVIAFSALTSVLKEQYIDIEASAGKADAFYDDGSLSIWCDFLEFVLRMSLHLRVTNDNQDSIAEGLTSTLSSFSSVYQLALADSAASGRDSTKILPLLVSHSCQWRRVITALPVSITFPLLPLAFDNLSTINKLKSSKKALPANVTDGMFHFWMFLHGIFALLATRGGESLTGFTNAAEEHHKSLEVSITNHPSIAKIRCDDASSEDNKMVYMNLVAPADSIGQLSLPLTKLLKSSRYHACVAYANIVQTLVQFPDWHRPHMTLKLLLRCMHHFLFLMPAHLVTSSKGEPPHSLNGLTASSRISSVLMAQRVISRAFLTLLLSLPRGAVDVLTSVGVTVPSQLAKSPAVSRAGTTATTPVSSRAISPAQGAGATATAVVAPTPLPSHTTSAATQLRVTMADMLHLTTVSATERLPPGGSEEMRCAAQLEYLLLMIHSQWAEQSLRHENACSLFEDTEDSRKARLSPRITCEDPLPTITYLPDDMMRSNRHWQRRERLLRGLFSFRRMFRREDLLFESDEGDKRSDTGDDGIEHHVDQLKSTVQTLKMLVYSAVPSSPATTDGPAVAAESKSINVDDWKQFYEVEIQQALRSISALWSLHVYRLAFSLFQQLRRLSTTDRSPRSPRDQQRSTGTVTSAEFKAYHHHHDDDDNDHQSLSGSQLPPDLASNYSTQASLVSQAWYQSTQLESLSGAVIHQSSQLLPPASVSHHRERTYRIEEYLLSPPSAAAANDASSTAAPPTHPDPPQVSKSGLSHPSLPLDRSPVEQLVLAAAHPLAIQVTQQLGGIVMDALAVVAAYGADHPSETTYCQQRVVHHVSVEFLQTMIESLWWFFHRTSGFGLDLEDVFPLSSPSNPPSNNSHRPKEYTATSLLQTTILWLQRWSSCPDTVRIPWPTMMVTAPTVMDWTLHVTWLQMLMQTRSHRHPPHDGKLEEPAALDSHVSVRLAHAMKKSMNSLTDAGLLPSLFATTSALLQHLLQLSPSTTTTTTAHSSEASLLNFCIPMTRKATVLLTSQGRLLLDQSRWFVQYALVKMASMAAPSTSEQYTPDLMTNMTTGLRDIFACILVLQQAPVVDRSVALTRGEANGLPIKEQTEAAVMSASFASPWMLWSVESLFGLWLMLEDLIYRYQYAQWYQTTWQQRGVYDTAKQCHSAVETRFDREALWPAVSSWALCGHVWAPIHLTSHWKSLCQRVFVYLRLSALLIRHEEQQQAASRIAGPLLRHFLSQLLAFCVIFLDAWTAPEAKNIKDHEQQDAQDATVIEAVIGDLVTMILRFPLDRCLVGTYPAVTVHIRYDEAVNDHEGHQGDDVDNHSAFTLTNAEDVRRFLAVGWLSKRMVVAYYDQANHDGDASLPAVDDTMRIWQSMTPITTLDSGRDPVDQVASFLRHGGVDQQAPTIAPAEAWVRMREIWSSSALGATPSVSWCISIGLSSLANCLLSLLVPATDAAAVVATDANNGIGQEDSGSNVLPVLSGITFVDPSPSVAPFAPVSMKESPVAPIATDDAAPTAKAETSAQPLTSLLQLPHALQVAQEAFYDVDDPIAAPQIDTAMEVDVDVHPLDGNEGNEGNDEDKAKTKDDNDDDADRTTDTLPAKASAKPPRPADATSTRLFDDEESNEAPPPVTSAALTDQTSVVQVDVDRSPPVVAFTTQDAIPHSVADVDVFPASHFGVKDDHNEDRSESTKKRPWTEVSSLSVDRVPEATTTVTNISEGDRTTNISDEQREVSHSHAAAAKRLKVETTCGDHQSDIPPSASPDAVDSILRLLQQQWQAASSSLQTEPTVDMHQSLHGMLQTTLQLSQQIHLILMATTLRTTPSVQLQLSSSRNDPQEAFNDTLDGTADDTDEDDR